MTSGRPWNEHPLVQLTRVRYREFFREPEAVFWVFVFPLLLAAGLGIAFRNRGPERVVVAVVADGPESDRLPKALAGSDELTVRALSESAAAQALRTGD